MDYSYEWNEISFSVCYINGTNDLMNISQYMDFLPFKPTDIYLRQYTELRRWLFTHSLLQPYIFFYFIVVKTAVAPHIWFSLFHCLSLEHNHVTLYYCRNFNVLSKIGTKKRNSMKMAMHFIIKPYLFKWVVMKTYHIDAAWIMCKKRKN